MRLVLLLIMLVISGLTLRFMIRNTPGSQVRRHFWPAVGFGVLATAVAMALELFGASLFGGNTESLGSFGQLPLALFLTFIGVGLIEEFAKFFPFSWFVRSKPYFNSVADSFIYFVIIGIVFAVLENTLYAIVYDSATTLLRISFGLFFHAALSGIVGFYFAKSVALKQSPRAAWMAYLVVAGLHGVYDYSLSMGAGGLYVIAAAVTIAANSYMFWLFYKANVFDYQFRTGHLPQPTEPGSGFAMMQQAAQPTPVPAPLPVVPQRPVQSTWQGQVAQPLQSSVPATPSYMPPAAPSAPAPAPTAPVTPPQNPYWPQR